MGIMRITGLPDNATLTGDELVWISQLSTTVDIAATTISALAVDNSYNDSANGFITAGFEVGMAVNVAGFTGNTVNNIQAGVITALTAGKMTIGGADGDVIVDDAAGELVSIIAWESFKCQISDLGEATDRAPDLLVPADIAGTSYTIQDTDRYACYRLTNAALVTITVPLNATEAVPIGARIRFIVLGVAGATIAKGDPSITIVSEDDAVNAAQNAVIELHKTGTDEWSLLGNFS